MYRAVVYVGTLVLGLALASWAGAKLANQHPFVAFLVWWFGAVLVIALCEQSRRKPTAEGSPVGRSRFVKGSIKWSVLSVLVALVELAILCRLLSGTGEPGRRMQCARNLWDIFRAMECYAAREGDFPCAHVIDESGRPMHSWRVLILPYLGEKELYDAYDFDQPWNSPHNRLVTRRMPRVYRCPSNADADEHTTNYVMIVGPATTSDGSNPTTGEDIGDGGAATVLVVEVKDSGIYWAEPRDLRFEEMTFMINDPNGKGIGSNHADGANVLFSDGAVELLKDSTDPQLVRAMTSMARGGDGSESLNPQPSTN